MKIEHFAFNVLDPIKMAAWYCENLGFQVRNMFTKPPYTHFLADSSGAVMIEIYCNPPDDVPDYKAMNPLQLHLAFVSEDPDKDCAKLEKAGANKVDDVRLNDGSHLIMLKDPWGFSLQLCKRGSPML